MKGKTTEKWLVSALLATLLAVSAVFPVFASGSIGNVYIYFNDAYETGVILEPEITAGTYGVSLESVAWSKDPDDWKPGSKVTATLLLTADDGRKFSSSYGERTCRISGANFQSARVENGKLRVTASYYPVVQLGAPYDAGWSNIEKTKASWDKVDYATGYQLRLYWNGEYIRTIDATGTGKDLSEYMTREGYYDYEIRAVAKDRSDYKYIKSGEYVESSSQTLQDLGDTDGRFRNYSGGKKFQKADGSYVMNAWHKIVGKWYYFNGEGYAVSGWQNLGGQWYFLDGEGVMLTGWQNLGGQWYFLNPDGVMLTGWCQVEPNQWYYLNPDGSMAANTVIDGRKLDGSGRWIE